MYVRYTVCLLSGDSTPLMEAASGGYADIVKLLIDHGAHVNAKSRLASFLKSPIKFNFLVLHTGVCIHCLCMHSYWNWVNVGHCGASMSEVAACWWCNVVAFSAWVSTA